MRKNSWKKLIANTDTKPDQRFHHTAVSITSITIIFFFHLQSIDTCFYQVAWSNGTVDEMVVFGGLSISQNPITNKKTEVNNLQITQSNEIWRLTIADSTNVSFVPFWEKDQLAKDDAVPTPRSEASSVLYKDQMIIFGGISYDAKGVSSPEDYNDIWSYDLQKRKWRKIDPTTDLAPPARFSHSSSLIYGW
jgi:hypothetical protein